MIGNVAVIDEKNGFRLQEITTSEIQMCRVV